MKIEEHEKVITLQRQKFWGGWAGTQELCAQVVNLHIIELTRQHGKCQGAVSSFGNSLLL